MVESFGVLLLVEDFLAADDDVAALLVELDDADFNLLAEIAVEVADGANLKLRAGQECLEADIDSEATLDAADDGACDRRFVVGSFFDCVPDAQALGPLVADQVAAFGLLALDDHVDDVAGLELDGSGVVLNLLERHQPLGLQSNIDDQVLFSLLDDGAGDDFVAIGLDGGGLGGLLAFKCLQRGGKIVSGLGGVRFVNRRLDGNLGGCGFWSGIDFGYGLGLRFSLRLWLGYNLCCSFDRRRGLDCDFNRRGLG